MPFILIVAGRMHVPWLSQWCRAYLALAEQALQQRPTNSDARATRAFASSGTHPDDHPPGALHEERRFSVFLPNLNINMGSARLRFLVVGGGLRL